MEIKKDDLPNMKQLRLQGYNYSKSGAYFLTICTDNKKLIFSDIVGCGILDAPAEIKLTYIGNIVLDTINYICNHDENIKVDKYVIMPNHIHMIIFQKNMDNGQNIIFENGTSRMPSPTNAVIPKFISSLKRYSNKRSGLNLWQRSYYNHIIRDENEYVQISQYIDENPKKWKDDELYMQ